MNGFQEFEAIIFDMDGLVLDSESTYSRAWQAAAEEIGKRLDQEMCESLFGQHADDVVRSLKSFWGSSFDAQKFFLLAERHWKRDLELNGIRRMDGFDRLYDRIVSQNIPFALATNSDGPYAQRCLIASNLDAAFSVLVTRDQVISGKPEPDLFLEAASRLGVRPDRCLVLEDSRTGLEAAKAAKMSAFLIQPNRTRREQLEQYAQLAMASLEDILPLLDGERASSITLVKPDLSNEIL